jgi:hypothetical protein
VTLSPVEVHFTGTVSGPRAVATSSTIIAVSAYVCFSWGTPLLDVCSFLCGEYWARALRLVRAGVCVFVCVCVCLCVHVVWVRAVRADCVYVWAVFGLRGVCGLCRLCAGCVCVLGVCWGWRGRTPFSSCVTRRMPGCVLAGGESPERASTWCGYSMLILEVFGGGWARQVQVYCVSTPLRTPPPYCSYPTKQSHWPHAL